MIVAIGVLAALAVGQAILLVVVLRQFAGERHELIDVIVSRHAGDLRAIRRDARPSVEQSPEVAAYEADRDRELKIMGYDPADVPRVPSGLDGR